MKKEYIKPTAKFVNLVSESIMAGSQGGVSTGSGPGNEYNEGDVSYSRQQGSPIWDNWSN